MAKPVDLPRFAEQDLENGGTPDIGIPSTPGSGEMNVVAPIDALKLSGWPEDSYPTRQSWNWFTRKTYQWLWWFKRLFAQDLDARDYGATQNRATLQAAITAIGSTNCRLHIYGSWTIDATPIVFHANTALVFMPGATITAEVPAFGSVTINAMGNDPHWQIIGNFTAVVWGSGVSVRGLWTAATYDDWKLSVDQISVGSPGPAAQGNQISVASSNQYMDMTLRAGVMDFNIAPTIASNCRYDGTDWRKDSSGNGAHKIIFHASQVHFSTLKDSQFTDAEGTIIDWQESLTIAEFPTFPYNPTGVQLITPGIVAAYGYTNNSGSAPADHAIIGDGYKGTFKPINVAGYSWDPFASATEANCWYSVTYGNGKFVAVASSGTNRVMWSVDGVTWTAAASATEANEWLSVTYGNGKFVAVTSSGTNRVMWSVDGVTWTAAASANEGNTWYSVTYGNGKFVAVAYTGTNKVMWSVDAITWTAAASATEANCWYSVTYGNGKFVAVASSGTNRVMCSVDGVTWTAAASANEGNTWYSVTYGNGKFVAVAYTGTNKVMWSVDAITWTAAASATEANRWYSVTYGNGKFVAVAYTGTNRVMWSVDGVTWTAAASATEGNGWLSVTYGNGKFVAVSYSGTNRVMCSGKTIAAQVPDHHHRLTAPYAKLIETMSGTLTVTIIPTLMTFSSYSPYRYGCSIDSSSQYVHRSVIVRDPGIYEVHVGVRYGLYSPQNTVRITPCAWDGNISFVDSDSILVYPTDINAELSKRDELSAHRLVPIAPASIYSRIGLRISSGNEIEMYINHIEFFVKKIGEYVAPLAAPTPP